MFSYIGKNPHTQPNSWPTAPHNRPPTSPPLRQPQEATGAVDHENPHDEDYAMSSPLSEVSDGSEASDHDEAPAWWPVSPETQQEQTSAYGGPVPRSPPPVMSRVVIEISDDEEEEQRPTPAPARPQTPIRSEEPAHRRRSAGLRLPSPTTRHDTLAARVRAQSSSANIGPRSLAPKRNPAASSDPDRYGMLAAGAAQPNHLTPLRLADHSTLNTRVEASAARMGLKTPTTKAPAYSSSPQFLDEDLSSQFRTQPSMPSRYADGTLFSNQLPTSSPPQAPTSPHALESIIESETESSTQPSSPTTPHALETILESEPGSSNQLSSPVMPPYSRVSKTGLSLERLHIAIRAVLAEGDKETIAKLAREMKHDWQIDEMAIFVEGYLRGALYERIASEEEE